MAKKGSGDSKIAMAGALALVLGIAGVVMVQQPLKSTRPPLMGGELKPQVAEGVARARLWEEWQGQEAELRLVGWSRHRRVIVLRRRLKNNVVAETRDANDQLHQIGRASCRERVYSSV